MSIATIRYNDSLDTILAEIEYTVARLTKNKHTKDLAGWGAPFIKRWEKVDAGQRAAWRAEVIAQAGVDEDNDDLDDTVSKVDKEIRHVDGDRTARHKRYFKRQASKVINMALESELVEVKEWPASLQTEPEAELQSLGKQLSANVASGQGSVGERARAQANTADHRVREINSFIDDLNGGRRALYGTLVTRSEQKKLPPKWAERFFRKSATRSGRKKAGAGAGDDKTKKK